MGHLLKGKRVLAVQVFNIVNIAAKVTLYITFLVLAIHVPSSRFSKKKIMTVMILFSLLVVWKHRFL